MDRLEHLHLKQVRGAPAWCRASSGAAVLCWGLTLALRAIRRGALRPMAARILEGWGGMAAVFAAMLTYSVVLVGHGIPFWLATAAFVAAFIFFFDRERQHALGRGTARQALLALVYGVAVSAVVTFAFQEVFYVRLP